MNDKITVICGDDQAHVPGASRYLGTDIGGGANRERYTVTIAGHEIEGTWSGDG